MKLPQTVNEPYDLLVSCSPKVFAELQQMQERAKTATTNGVVLNALRFYKWFLEQELAGHKLQLVKGDDVLALEFEF